jgi:hypothetical protein
MEKHSFQLTKAPTFHATDVWTMSATLLTSLGLMIGINNYYMISTQALIFGLRGGGDLYKV